jgi:hypothetical protein
LTQKLMQGDRLMSRIHSPAAGRMQTIARNPAMIALFMTLALAGCASKKNLPNNAGDLGLNGAGAATPGSQQDFTVNVGDRIFFDTDSTSIRADAAATLDRQAQWLQQYPNYAITVEGHADERGTRVPRVARRSGQPHEDDLLRQGKAGCRLRRHFLLVAEPPRRDRSRWRRHVIPSPEGSCGRRPRGRLSFFNTLWPNSVAFWEYLENSSAALRRTMGPTGRR